MRDGYVNAGITALVIAVAGMLLMADDARINEVAMMLALVCGGLAASVVLVATYRERVVVGRLVRKLRNPETRAATLSGLRERVEIAMANGDAFRVEEALRFALEPMIVAGLWDEVGELTDRVAPNGGSHLPFWRWLAGVRALAALHRNDTSAAKKCLEGVEIKGGWLAAVDALRLAIDGEGKAALVRLESIDGKVGVAARHQRQLAQVHAFAAVGRRDEVRVILESAMEADRAFVETVRQLEGPASPIARAVLGKGAGPFRAAG